MPRRATQRTSSPPRETLATRLYRSRKILVLGYSSVPGFRLFQTVCLHQMLLYSASIPDWDLDTTYCPAEGDSAVDFHNRLIAGPRQASHSGTRRTTHDSLSRAANPT